jgi:hypothetical protein
MGDQTFKKITKSTLIMKDGGKIIKNGRRLLKWELHQHGD